MPPADRTPAWATRLQSQIDAMRGDMEQIKQQAAARVGDADHKFQETRNGIAEILKLLGGESDDGKGGQGLRGEVRRISARVQSLESDRAKFWGAVAAITASAAILILGLKAWITSLFTSPST
ncbi:hypothetical protein [Phenylobacterium sp.]|uniref:hypothetical protein n=1 Tax=Phenylobacterium sp. TaxID=1871053 RepID=UPI002737BDED|nr:hypothetical protein [Phenylobacterium sp.]MDP3869204.1 hypothetical protein [Phenylobacterium sp.]